MNALGRDLVTSFISPRPAHRPLAEHLEDLPALAKRINAPKVERNPGPARPWLITIVDLMTILLTFFVLLFSMSKIDMVRFIPVARSYGEAFAGGLPDENAPTLPSSFKAFFAELIHRPGIYLPRNDRSILCLLSWSSPVST